MIIFFSFSDETNIEILITTFDFIFSKVNTSNIYRPIDVA